MGQAATGAEPIMSLWTVLVIAAIGLLALLTVLKVFIVDRRKHEAFKGLQRISHHTARLVRSLLIRHADEDVAFRRDLISAITDAKMLCDDCPLRRSSICSDCGRYASGEGRTPDEAA